jgi:hypothetical protein
MPDVGVVLVEIMRALEDLKSNKGRKAIELKLGKDGIIKFTIEVKLEKPRLKVIREPGTS